MLIDAGVAVNDIKADQIHWAKNKRQEAAGVIEINGGGR
jgi:hypothetical protein